MLCKFCDCHAVPSGCKLHNFQNAIVYFLLSCKRFRNNIGSLKALFVIQIVNLSDETAKEKLYVNIWYHRDEPFSKLMLWIWSRCHLSEYDEELPEWIYYLYSKKNFLTDSMSSLKRWFRKISSDNKDSMYCLFWCCLPFMSTHNN